MLTCSFLKAFHLSWHFRYHRLIEEYSDVIVGQFFGHQNTDTFRVFYNKKSKCSGITNSWHRHNT